ncbi:hypothetical protein L6164_020830 [Bauhinia variegata]|uniref:Uncharacterized protein n=1 Tax=Bauhinia variegata TaxID=167791 RepID=A0ACB9MWN0_BAUVA|nr:hypothetical protein L6164_020830 [Bauhinia variegata]
MVGDAQKWKKTECRYRMRRMKALSCCLDWEECVELVQNEKKKPFLNEPDWVSPARLFPLPNLCPAAPPDGWTANELENAYEIIPNQISEPNEAHIPESRSFVLLSSITPRLSGDIAHLRSRTFPSILEHSSRRNKLKHASSHSLKLQAFGAQIEHTLFAQT